MAYFRSYWFDDHMPAPDGTGGARTHDPPPSVRTSAINYTFVNRNIKTIQSNISLPL